jgi:uncharacterized surface protein with fasciclin (FAS1) repeats
VPTDVLSQVLLNHVISGNILSTDLSGRGYTKSNALGAGGNTLSLYYDATNGVEFNDNSSVTTADVNASNGTIHIVDKVIGLPSIVDHAVYNDNFSVLTAFLIAEGFDDVLNGEGPFTVLAPGNSAFENFSNPDGNLLSQVLLNHVVSGAITSELLLESAETFTSTLASGPNDAPISIYANTSDGVRFNGVSSVSTADIIGTNGIIHAVDGVIDIPTVVTFAAANPNFTSLVAALAEADSSDADPMLIPTLSGYDGTYTVFAPLNSAFDTLLNSNPAWDGVEDIDDNVLNSVLLHHVVSGNVRSGNLEVGANVAATLEGDEITITLPGTEPNIADVTDGAGNSDIGIVTVDVQAGNGVIHVLNKVMLPELE